MGFDCFYFKFGNLFEKTNFIFTLIKKNGSSGQKFHFSGPGSSGHVAPQGRDTWQLLGDLFLPFGSSCMPIL